MVEAKFDHYLAHMEYAVSWNDQSCTMYYAACGILALSYYRVLITK